jgi:hypothetical protein
MPDTRRHRGPHPEDAELFAPARWPILRAAVADLSWLLSRGYAENSSLKLVGDRFQLTERQRIAVLRSACSDQALQHRQQIQLPAARLAGERLDIDGFNVLTTVEAALAQGVILAGRDGCYRDMASMHGSYRNVDESEPALTLIGEVLNEFRLAECHWYLDRPVSNSGRLRARLEVLAAKGGWSWQVELATDVDAVLAASPHVVATADSVILDRCARWCNLAREILDGRLPDVTVVILHDGLSAGGIGLRGP